MASQRLIHTRVGVMSKKPMANHNSKSGRCVYLHGKWRWAVLSRRTQGGCDALLATDMVDEEGLVAHRALVGSRSFADCVVGSQLVWLIWRNWRTS